MVRILPAALLLAVFCLPGAALASGKAGFAAVKQCVMQNDVRLCHDALTPSSHELFDRFYAYRLMPCLPTDFTYDSEKTHNGMTIVKAVQDAGGNRQHVLRLVFQDDKLDLPQSLQLGLGQEWQNRLNMAEQVFLMIRASTEGDFRCDQVNNLVKK